MYRQSIFIIALILTSIGTLYALNGAGQVEGEKIYDDFREKHLSKTTTKVQVKKIEKMMTTIDTTYISDTATPETIEIMMYVRHLLCHTRSILNGKVCFDNYVTNETLTAAVKEWKLADIRKTTIREHSQRRIDRGLGGLTESKKLDNIAQKYAAKLCAAGYIDHHLNGSTIEQRYASGRYDYEYAAENLAQGQRNVAELLDQLTTSIHHRENMYNTHLTEIGIGYCDDIWVLNYGKPYVPEPKGKKQN